MLKGYLKELTTTYTTTGLVRVRSPIIATTSLLLVGLVWFSALASIRLDIRRMYKSPCPIRGAVLSKVKGFTSTEKLTDSDLLIQHPELYRKMWDSSDLVYPIQGGEGGSGSFTIITNLVITPNQTLRTCAEKWSAKSECHTDAHCQEGFWTPGTSNGIYTGKCIASKKTCEIQGWCPPPSIDVLPRNSLKPLLEEVANFTVFLKNTIEFSKCGDYQFTNVANRTIEYQASCMYDKETDPFCPKFRIGDIVKWSGDDFNQAAIWGGVFRIRIKWKCEFDIFGKPGDCQPKYKFSRVDSISKHVASKGWNFVSVDYTENNQRTHKRQMGLKIIIDLEGEGRKFDFFLFMTTLGSTIGLFSVAPLICGFLLDVFNWLTKRGKLRPEHHEYCDRFGKFEVGDDCEESLNTRRLSETDEIIQMELEDK